MTVEEQIKEGRTLAAWLCAYGHPECGEALHVEMPDKDRIPMFRYDFGTALESPGLPEDLRIRLERFVNAT